MNQQLQFQKTKIGLGKRKRAIARVFLIPGNGKMNINQLPAEKYLQYNYNYIASILEPLKKLKLTTKYDIIALVNGGGLSSQKDAIQLGITRLICQQNFESRKILKPFGFLTRDPRIKERKKYGLKKARKAPQYSKR